MRDLGFGAVVTLSLTDPAMPARLRLPDGDPRSAPIRVSNPLSLEHSELRTTLLGPLLEAARFNLAHGAASVALFESGRAYLGERSATAPAVHGSVLAGAFAGDREPPAYEPHRIACVALGALAPASWRGPSAAADFFALKGALETLAAQLGTRLEIEPGEEPFLHPGRSAQVLVAGEPAGWIGEIHPLVARQFDLEAAAGFEVDLAPAIATADFGRERYEDVTTFPAVYQDIAVVVDDEVPAARVRASVLEGGGDLLRSARVFDLYRGEQLGQGQKSLALRLEFRADDRTLTDEEVAALRERIKERLGEIGGSLRE
jgi:phenylalanyl-tRNA synthetase beta chain